MKFWNWGPAIIWHNLGCVAFYFSKTLHPTVHCTQAQRAKTMWNHGGIYGAAQRGEID